MDGISIMPMITFQSTPPARGATIKPHVQFMHTQFQSTPPARGATVISCFGDCSGVISIHAPREGGDPAAVIAPGLTNVFQSTPPARGATFRRQRRGAGGDHFNPRPPRGGRRGPLSMLIYYHDGFQSTPPARGATSAHVTYPSATHISIHAPREGGDILPLLGPLLLPISIHAPREGGDS